MKNTYTVRQVDMGTAQLRKIDARFAKSGKLLDGKEEREAHVVLALERHLHNTEITVTFHGHQLIGVGADADLFTAIHAAVEKLEKQAVKIRTKWRDTKRQPRKEASTPPPPAQPKPEPEAEAEGRIF